MIAYLQGNIILRKEKFVVLESQGVGYRVFLSQKTLKKISGQEKFLKLFCFLYVRENILNLYGFLTWGEREVFEMLIGISGVGPKAALEISGLGPLEDLKKSIKDGQEKIFEGISGIGRKRAAKILLELSGKIKNNESLKPKERISEVVAGINNSAFDALVNMGFLKQEAKETLSKLPIEMDAENKIKEALKMLGK